VAVAGLVVSVLACPAIADDHAHHAGAGDPASDPVPGDHAHPASPSLGASIGLVLADYTSKLFAGDYRGANLGVRLAHGRVGLAVALPAYRLTKNGRTVDGLGDLAIHAHAWLIARGTWSAGAMVMTSLPTGDGDEGLGMGHVMWMPELWASWMGPRLSLGAAVGYSHALGGTTAHAEHGGGSMWPLVSPMNASELTGGGTAMIGLAHELGVGLHLQGAVPVGEGERRLIGGLRVLWTAGRTATTVEIQHGLVGDPFGVRGVVETAIRFR